MRAACWGFSAARGAPHTRITSLEFTPACALPSRRQTQAWVPRGNLPPPTRPFMQCPAQLPPRRPQSRTPQAGHMRSQPEGAAHRSSTDTCPPHKPGSKAQVHCHAQLTQRSPAASGRNEIRCPPLPTATETHRTPPITVQQYFQVSIHHLRAGVANMRVPSSGDPRKNQMWQVPFHWRKAHIA